MASLIVDFPRRTVNFSPTSTLHRYNTVAPSIPLPHDQLQGNQQKGFSFSSSSYWYSSEEEELAKAEAKREIMILRLIKESGHDIKDLPDNCRMVLCPFGLENALISQEWYTKRRAIAKRLVTFAVLTEQAKLLNKINHECTGKEGSSQEDDESEDDKWDRIAAVSCQHSEWSRRQARSIGLFQANDNDGIVEHQGNPGSEESARTHPNKKIL